MNPTYEHHRPYDGCDLYRGDALDVLPLLAEEGITADMVLSDPPYGTTHCRWDAVIDIPGMWNAVQGISRPDTPVLLFCQHPFTSLLGSSNLRRLRYAWVWEKTQATGFLNAGRMPIRRTRTFWSSTTGCRSIIRSRRTGQAQGRDGRTPAEMRCRRDIPEAR